MYTKGFINGEDTKRICKTLKEARKINRFEYVYRVWINEETNVRYVETVTAYGEQVCTIKQADSHIQKQINKTK